MIYSKKTLKLLVIAVAMLVMLSACQKPQATDGATTKEKKNVLQAMLDSKKLRVGFAGYPPYLINDLKTGEKSGYSVDIIKQILDPVDVKIEWVETTWDNMKQDLILGKFDVMIEPIFMTIPRSARVGFTRPYAYFGYAAAIVKKGDKRFKTVQDFNSKNITLAVTQGVTDQEYATVNLPNANLKVIPNKDISITMTEVLAGKADAALADVPTILEFVKAHPKDVDAIFVDNPPATTPAAFMAAQDQVEFINFLNNALLYLEANGTFEKLESKYQLPSFREKKIWIRGSGLSK